MTTIGIPRSLLYYRNDVLWQEFFSALGCETVVSPQTNKRILEKGSSLAVDESCLPLKIQLGHIDALRGKADAVLVPRLVSVDQAESVCVKYWATYDIARNVFDDIDIVGYSVDEGDGGDEETAMRRLGATFERNPWKVRRAYRSAKAAQREADERHARETLAALARPSDLRVLVAAHAYNLHDHLLGKPVTDFLATQGVDVVGSDGFEGPEWARLGRERMSPGMYWTYNAELLGAVEHCREKVDGIVFLVTFPCGPDSLMTELVRRKLSDVPLLVIVLDELQAEAGLRTRLESFIDIVRMRKGSVVA